MTTDTVTGGVQVDLVVGANTITVTVTAEDGSTTGTYSVVVTRADETDPPVLDTAVVNGSSLVLAYSEDLDTGSEPAVSDFAVDRHRFGDFCGVGAGGVVGFDLW